MSFGLGPSVLRHLEKISPNFDEDMTDVWRSRQRFQLKPPREFYTDVASCGLGSVKVNKKKGCRDVLGPIKGPTRQPVIYTQCLVTKMNGVPIDFYERVCAFLSVERLKGAKELSGHYTIAAETEFNLRSRYVVTFKDGTIKPEHLLFECDRRIVETPKEIAAVPKKFVRSVYIKLRDAKGTVYREAVQQFPYACYHFTFYSSSINEAWVDFACSLKGLGIIRIGKKLKEDALRLFEKLVTGQKLSNINIASKAIGGAMMGVLKSVICQDQFEKLAICIEHNQRWSGCELLEFWAQNSERMKGKRLFLLSLGDTFKPLEDIFIQRAQMSNRAQAVGIEDVLEVCSKEECDFIDKEYLNSHYTCAMPSCVYKFEEGEDGKRRRIYISYDCAGETQIVEPWRPASHSGHNDLRLLRDTEYVHILFG
uniref:PAZ domain-containing protein n=1 Tax=Steinernema glaseri TaxID=37863 RepID=A0A1I7YX42_9BILA